MTTARVWAPARATVDPDRVVLALLEVGDDPEKDLGAALLAVHRAGAAACQLVAAAPVPDEVALIATLAQCRSRVAPAVAECVSKSVDDPQYAHLLTRDVFDDAEQAALSLFRACVAKGVSPPLACQRVGHVFGVPREHLGRYFALATNPATGAVALVDAADRALLAHVAKVARSETEDTKVTISKAPEPERAPRNPAFEARVRRDEEGRFAEEEAQPPDRLTRIRRRLGITGAAPRVGGAPPVTPEPGQVGRRTRKGRVQRRRAPATQTVAQSEVQATVSSGVRSGLKMSSLDSSVQARTEAGLRKLEAKTDRPTPPARSLLTAPDVMKTRPADGPFHELRDELSVSMPVEEGEFFRSQMVGQGVSGEPFIFRMGHLSDAAGEMEIYGSNAAQHHRQAVARRMWAEQDSQHEPIVTRIRRNEMTGDTEGFVEHLRNELATDVIQTDQGPIRRVNQDRLDLIVEYQDALSDDILLVEHRPTSPDLSAVLVTVDEFVVADGAIGRVEGTGRHTQVVLDPNKAYAVMDRRPMRFFDEKSHAIINRWSLMPIEEGDAQRIVAAHRIRRGQGDIDKAAHPERARNPAFEATVNRDEDGRFAEEEETAAAPVRRVRVQRKGRVERTGRVERKGRVQAQVTVSPVSTQAQSELRSTLKSNGLAAGVRAGVQSGLTAHLARPRSALPELHDSRQYHVLNQAQMHELMRLADLPTTTGTRRLGYAGKEYLFGHAVHSGSAAATVMRENVSAMVYDNEGGLRPRALFRMKATSEDDLEELGRAINKAFDRDPKLAELTIEPVGVDDYQVYGNHYPVGDQYLIEYDDDVDFDAPLELMELGKHRTKDMLMVGKDSWPLLSVAQAMDSPFNAPVQLFRLHNTGVRRFRVGRDD